MKSEKKAVKVKIIFLLLIGLIGCAAKGPYFSGVSEPAENKATIYIYRPWAFTCGGVSFQIIINNKRISPKLSNQSYLSYVTTPGTTRIHTNTSAIDNVLEFTAEANKTYFVSISVKNYVMVFSITPYLVDKNLALKEIKKCQLAQ